MKDNCHFVSLTIHSLVSQTSIFFIRELLEESKLPKDGYHGWVPWLGSMAVGSHGCVPMLGPKFNFFKVWSQYYVPWLCPKVGSQSFYKSVVPILSPMAVYQG